MTQHPIDAMLQFDANANAHTNVDARVNGPLEINDKAKAQKEMTVSPGQFITFFMYSKRHFHGTLLVVNVKSGDF